jgi:cytochrome c551/c552
VLKLQPWRWIVLAACAIVLVGVLYRGHQVSEGQEAFERLGCSTCHSAGGGPSLEHVARKYDRATLVAFVANPETIYSRMGRKPLNPGYPPMPSPQASHRDVEAISYFLSAQR